MGCDAGADGDCDAGDLAVGDLTFSGVDSGADRQSKIGEIGSRRARAPDRTRGAVKAREKTVAGVSISRPRNRASRAQTRR